MTPWACVVVTARQTRNGNGICDDDDWLANRRLRRLTITVLTCARASDYTLTIVMPV